MFTDYKSKCIYLQQFLSLFCLFITDKFRSGGRCAPMGRLCPIGADVLGIEAPYPIQQPQNKSGCQISVVVYPVEVQLLARHLEVNNCQYKLLFA